MYDEFIEECEQYHQVVEPPTLVWVSRLDTKFIYLVGRYLVLRIWCHWIHRSVEHSVVSMIGLRGISFRPKERTRHGH